RAVLPELAGRRGGALLPDDLDHAPDLAVDGGDPDVIAERPAVADADARVDEDARLALDGVGCCRRDRVEPVLRRDRVVRMELIVDRLLERGPQTLAQHGHERYELEPDHD